MSNISRHQAGTQIAGQKTGGQFKAASKTGASMSALGSSDGLCPVHGSQRRNQSVEAAALLPDCTCPATVVDTVESLPVEYEWQEHGVLPTPRHRKPVTVTHTEQEVVQFRSVSREDVGEAFEVPGDNTHDGYEVVHFDGQLWQRKVNRQTKEPIPATPENLHDSVHGGYYTERHESVEEAKAHYAREAQSYLVIDGEIWAKTGEPGYSVSAFGLPGNHGGTALMRTVLHPMFGDNRLDSIFSADEFEEAKAHALKVAEERGDTESIDRIKRTEPTVTLPADRPWEKPVMPIRIPDYSTPYDIPWEERDRPEPYRAALKHMQDYIREHAPEAIYTDDHGAQRVDLSKFTEGAEEAYRELKQKLYELERPDLDTI